MSETGCPPYARSKPRDEAGRPKTGSQTQRRHDPPESVQEGSGILLDHTPGPRLER